GPSIRIDLPYRLTYHHSDSHKMGGFTARRGSGKESHESGASQRATNKLPGGPFGSNGAGDAFGAAIDRFDGALASRLPDDSNRGCVVLCVREFESLAPVGEIR